VSEDVVGPGGIGPDALGTPGPAAQAATRQRQVVGTALAIAYVLTILLANYAITHWGRAPAFPDGPYTWPVWPGIEAPSGVLFAGLAFTLRDLTQEWLGRKVVFLAIVVGAFLSYAVTSNRDLAVASGVAFLFSELADWGVYQPLRERRWLAAVFASNLVGLVIDSILFLWIAFDSLDFIEGQIIGKIWTTIVAVLLLLWLRRWAIPRSSRPADEPEVPQIA
jgi:uncharacterized PurR-regulated membrane protein YhhQ (DUF165 family)